TETGTVKTFGGNGYRPVFVLSYLNVTALPLTGLNIKAVGLTAPSIVSVDYTPENRRRANNTVIPRQDNVATPSSITATSTDTAAYLKYVNTVDLNYGSDIVEVQQLDSAIINSCKATLTGAIGELTTHFDFWIE